MMRLSVSAATLAALGLVASLPFAAPAAFAGGGKPAPAAKPAAKPAAEKYASLDELEAAADTAEAAARKDLRRVRYEKVVAYLAANPDAKDREEAVGTAMDLAAEVEEWAKAVEHADAYLKAYEQGERRIEVLVAKAGALSHAGTKEATQAAYGAAFDRALAAGVEMHVWRCRVTAEEIVVDTGLPFAPRETASELRSLARGGESGHILGSPSKSLP